MAEYTDFKTKGLRETIYWKNTYTNEDAVFRETTNGEKFTKLTGGKEFQSDNSTLAFDAAYYDLHEISKEEYDNFS